MINITKERVRYAETDAMGVTHHANYLLWMEIGRTNLLRDMELPYKKLEEDGIMLPVTKLGVKYIAPTFYDDEIFIHSVCTLAKGVRMRIDYKIYRNGNEIVATGYTEHAVLDSHTRKPKRIPGFFLDKIKFPENIGDFANTI
jgi:acyl-CoA thioester hydrolase